MNVLTVIHYYTKARVISLLLHKAKDVLIMLHKIIGDHTTTYTKSWTFLLQQATTTQSQGCSQNYYTFMDFLLPHRVINDHTQKIMDDQTTKVIGDHIAA